MKSYQNLLRDILTLGENHNDRTGVGTVSLFGYQFRHDMRSGFPLLTTKQLPFRHIFEELAWFLRGSTDNKELQDRKVTIWNEWSTAEKCAKFHRQENDLGPIYGWQWRHYGATYTSLNFRSTEQQMFPNINSGFDQIDWLLNEIKINPFSRRLIVTGWNPIDAQDVELPPCHTIWQLKCNAKRQMSLHLYARSIDAFLGLPFNIASYALLLEMLCITCGYEAKELIISFGDLHIYKNHIEQVAEQLYREPMKLPRITFMRGDQFEIYSLDYLLSMRYDHFDLIGYNPQPKIPAPVAI